MTSDLEDARRTYDLTALILRELARLGGSCDVEILVQHLASRSPIAERFQRKQAGRWDFEDEFHAAMMVLITLDEVRRVRVSNDHRADRYEIVSPLPGEEYDAQAVEQRRREVIYWPYPATPRACSCAHDWKRRTWLGNDIRYYCAECGRGLRRYDSQLNCGERGREGDLCAWPECVAVPRSDSQRDKDARRRRRWTAPPEPDDGD